MGALLHGLHVRRAPGFLAQKQRCLEAWASIGVSPFNEKVYWGLRSAEEKAKKVATVNEVNLELLTLKGVVGIMSVWTRGSNNLSMQSGRRCSREACLHSSDLWDLPGGATGDECFSIVKAKAEAKQAKVDASKAAKARRVEGRKERWASSLALGSHVVASLCHDAQLSALKLPALQAALALKGVNVPHGMKKHALVELLRSKLMLPSNGAAPAVPDVHVNVSVADLAPVAGPSAPDVDESGSAVAEPDGSDEDM